MRYRVIVNPAAGRGAAAAAVPAIQAHLRNLGLAFELVYTERRWHAAELARAAACDGVDIIVAVGGDGTVNEVLNGLVMARDDHPSVFPALGVLSTGRGNDFAFALGIPTELEAGCRVLAQAQRRPIDIGYVTGGDDSVGRYFGNGVGIGFDAVVGFVAARQPHLKGFLCYIVATLKTILLYYEAPLVSIEYAGRNIEQPTLMISVMNGQRMGGGFMMAPQGDPADGHLNLCIARQVPRLRILTMIPHFMRGTQATQAPITTARTDHIAVTALQGNLPAHADGETLATATQKLEITLVPQLIDVIAPTRASQRTKGH